MAFLPASLLWMALLVPLTQHPAPAADAALPSGTSDGAAADHSAPSAGAADEREKAEQAPDKPPTPQHTGSLAILRGLRDDVTNLPSERNLVFALIGGGMALGAHPFDRTVNARLVSHYDIVNTIFVPAKYYGGTPEQLALSVGTWAIGRVTHKPKLSHLGMDLLRAQAVTALLVEPLKFATHRQRPDLSDYRSFPSGHAAVTFATATVIERHLGWRKSLIAYAVASYVAASRLHDNRHYLSDVVFGATIGSIAGRTVTTHGRDTWTLVPVPAQGGLGIGVTRSTW